MKITWSSSQWYLKATIYPFGDYKSSIEIERSRPFGAKGDDTWPEARINWPSIGSVNRAKVEVFSRGLLEAIKIAEVMNRPVRRDRTTYQ